MKHVSAEALFEFMPYGAPELKEVARKYMFRGVLLGSAAWLILFLLSFGTSAFLRHQPHETSVVVVPYRELAAPPPLTENTPPPQVAVALPVHWIYLSFAVGLSTVLLVLMDILFRLRWRAASQGAAG